MVAEGRENRVIFVTETRHYYTGYLWRDSLYVTCGLTACPPGSAPGPTLGNEYGKTLPVLFIPQATATDLSVRLRERKCAENYNKWHNNFFKTAISILVISKHNGFRVRFDKIASALQKINLYTSALLFQHWKWEIASPENRHCAKCIGTLSFPMFRSHVTGSERR